jgi:HSP20 family protein
LKGFGPPPIAKDGDAVVRVELPGIDVEKDVNVEVDKGQLVIHGERRDERAEEKDGRTLSEVRYGCSPGRSGCRRMSTGTRSPRRTTPAC